MGQQCLGSDPDIQTVKRYVETQLPPQRPERQSLSDRVQKLLQQWKRLQVKSNILCLHDLMLLKKHGVCLEKLGSSVTGTVLHTEADNLAAHSLGEFHESFVSDKVCRFCMATRQEIQDKEISSVHFSLRTKQEHDQQVLEVQQDDRMAKQYGVKDTCPISEHLELFHVVSPRYPS